MLVVRDGSEWRPSTAADATSARLSFYLAYQSDESHDVQAAERLVGLDCSDDYEVQTGYYADEDYAVDDPLTAGEAGQVTIARFGDVIIGQVTRVGTAANNALAYAGRTPPTATIAAAAMLQFKTAHNNHLWDSQEYAELTINGLELTLDGNPLVV